MTAVDPRLTRARDALDTAALHPVASLPPSVMARELAELRQALGQLLTLVNDFEAEEQEHDVTRLTPSGGARISPAGVLVLGAALADAIEQRCEHTDGPCSDCDADPSGLCALAVENLDQADAYRALAGELGLAVDQ